jgi:hypothetical protein
MKVLQHWAQNVSLLNDLVVCLIATMLFLGKLVFIAELLPSKCNIFKPGLSPLEVTKHFSLRGCKIDYALKKFITQVPENL